MERFFIRKIEMDDIDLTVAIYNSNRDFLIHHLYKEKIDREFIENELKEMQDHGFKSNLVLDDDKAIGIIDYMHMENGYVYLSLMMIDSLRQHKGIGTALYKYFEGIVMENGAKEIRIDVVNDYEGNVVPFWESMGFVGEKEDELTWGEKTSKVLVMKKYLKENYTAVSN